MIYRAAVDCSVTVVRYQSSLSASDTCMLNMRRIVDLPGKSVPRAFWVDAADLRLKLLRSSGLPRQIFLSSETGAGSVLGKCDLKMGPAKGRCDVFESTTCRSGKTGHIHRHSCITPFPIPTVGTEW